mgnify:CR=1 FL=1
MKLIFGFLLFMSFSAQAIVCSNVIEEEFGDSYYVKKVDVSTEVVDDKSYDGCPLSIAILNQKFSTTKIASLVSVSKLGAGSCHYKDIVSEKNYSCTRD